MTNGTYKLLEPYELKHLTLRNRIAVAPMGTMMSGADGSVTQRQIDYLTHYAKGGAGIVMPEAMGMDDAEGKGTPNMVALWSTVYISKLNELAEGIRDNGAACFAQIAHAGYQTIPSNIGGRQPIAASAIANALTGVMPRAATEEDIALIEENYVIAAVNAQSPWLTRRFFEVRGRGGQK